MKERAVTMPQIGLIAVTRVAFGIGIGLLLSGKLDEAHVEAQAGRYSPLAR